MTTIDDFESGNLEDYTIYNTNGSLEVVNDSSIAYQGNYALEVDYTAPSFSGSYASAISSDGLGAYPSQGDTFSFWMQTESVNTSNYSGYFGMIFGHQNNSENYFVGIESGPTVTLGMDISIDGFGTVEQLASGDSLNTDEYYEFEVEWSSTGEITLTVYEEDGSVFNEMSSTDTSYSDGDFGWTVGLQFGDEISAEADYATLSLPEPPTAPSGLQATFNQ